MTDTAYVPVKYCPGCEPRRDPTAECLILEFCAAHPLVRDGVDDDKVAAGASLSGSDEAGGVSNRAWCDLLHRTECPR